MQMKLKLTNRNIRCQDVNMTEFSRKEFELLGEPDGPWPVDDIRTSKWLPKGPVEKEESQAVHRWLSRFVILALGKKPQAFERQNKLISFGARYILIPVEEGAFMKLTLVCSRNCDEGCRVYLYSPGNFETLDDWEDLLNHGVLAGQLGAKGVILDYRLYDEKGEKLSKGISKGLALKIHRLGLCFIEEELLGREIILIGRSLGAGIQAESLRGLELKPESRYVAVSTDAFSDYSEAASELLSSFAGRLIRYFNWNLRTAEALNGVMINRVVIQSIEGEKVTIENQFTQKVKDDGLIKPKAALAPALEANGRTTYYFGIPNREHNDPLYLEEWGVNDKIIALLEK